MDTPLKQRLIGAIVLVALGVIFVPMILEGPDRTLVPEMAALPVPEDRAISPPLESFPAPDAIPVEPEISTVLTDLPPVSGSDAAGESAQPVVEPEPEPEPVAVKPESRNKPAKPGPLSSWVVQMGSFSSEKNALRLRDKLRKSGFATQVEKVRIEGKSRYRVRVGPFLKRVEAQHSQKQIQDKLTLKGRVLSYP